MKLKKNPKYLNRFTSNTTERAVQEWFIGQGYKSLHRGWPDFAFWKRRGGKQEVIFVEVKRRNQTKIKASQLRVKKLFESLGLTHRVAYGMKDDGTPNFE